MIHERSHCPRYRLAAIKGNIACKFCQKKVSFFFLSVEIYQRVEYMKWSGSNITQKNFDTFKIKCFRWIDTIVWKYSILPYDHVIKQHISTQCLCSIDFKRRIWGFVHYLETLKFENLIMFYMISFRTINFSCVKSYVIQQLVWKFHAFVW